MPKISDEKRAARRAQILDAARACFQKNGLHATTMEDIIRASGLSAGAVYSYFKGKDELILAAVTSSLGALRALLEPLLKAEPLPSPVKLTERIMSTIDDFSKREGYDLKRIALLGWSEAQRNENLRVTMSGFYAAFRDLLAAAAARWKQAGLLQEGSSPENVAKALLAVILGFVVEAAIIGDTGPEDIAAGLGGLGVNKSGLR